MQRDQNGTGIFPGSAPASAPGLGTPSGKPVQAEELGSSLLPCSILRSHSGFLYLSAHSLPSPCLSCHVVSPVRPMARPWDCWFTSSPPSEIASAPKGIMPLPSSDSSRRFPVTKVNPRVLRSSGPPPCHLSLPAHRSPPTGLVLDPPTSSHSPPLLLLCIFI